MAINKAFVVKNGLEVNTDLILANASTKRVGIGSTIPLYTLDVRGGIGATNTYTSGISTIINELRVGTGGTVFSVIAGPTGVGQSVGVGTANPGYLLDVRSPVSTGQTALYVYGDARITGDLVVEDDLVLDEVTVRNINVTGINTSNNLNVTGIATIATLGVTGLTTTRNLTVIGVTTTNTLSIGATQVISSARQLQNIASLDATTTATIEAAIANGPNTFTDITVSGVSTFVGLATFNSGLQVVSGITTLGVTTATNVTAQQLNVSGITTLGVTTATNVTAQQLNVSGVSTFSSTINHNAATFATNQTTYNLVNTTATNLNFGGAATALLMGATTGIATIRNTTVSLPNATTLIGFASSTGTASQRLQVSGGAYVNGNLGIGTTNPTRLVHAFGDATTNQLLGGISVTTLNTTGYGAYHGLNATSISSGRDYRLLSAGNSDSAGVGKFSVYDATAGLNRLVIDSSGNVGLATTNPSSTLHVIGNSLITGVTTLGTVQVSSGIITATSGIVTYYGNGSFLTGNARNLTATIGLGTTGGVVGYGVSFIQFAGPGVSTVYYNGTTGIATVNITGGGSGSASIGIGSTPGDAFVGIITAGNLWYNSNLGRLFIYYQDTDSAQWVDASPSNVGVITSLTNVSFAPGSASSPSMYFIGDPQTGFFSPGAGQFTVVSTGSSVLNINPNGINVTGIVTSTSVSTGNINSSGVVTATDFDSLSDIRYKENITTVDSALSKVDQLRGVKFDWKESGLPSYGVIAQELEEVLPELVHGSDPKTVNYNGIIGVLIEAIKELKAEVEELKKDK